eukprot:5618163-Karenia_brevis.AAC.1
MSEFLKEVQARSWLGGPSRIVNVSDSKVVVHAFAKGRSSAFRLNHLIRKTLGFLILGRKEFVNLWVRTDVNPSDDPSRFVQLRAPQPAP